MDETDPQLVQPVSASTGPMGQKFLDAAFAPRLGQVVDDATAGTRNAMTAQVAPSVAPTNASPIAPPSLEPKQATQEEPLLQLQPRTVQTTDERTQFQSGRKLDPTIIAQTMEARADQSAAMSEQASIQAKAEERVAIVEQERAAALARQEEERKQKEQDRQEAQAAEMQKYRDAQAELDKIQDPKEGVGTKIGYSIAILLGGFGQALGGQNNVNQVIESDRAQRLNAWKAQYARTQGKVASAGNLYALARQQGLDATSAEALATQQLNKGYDAQISAIAARSKAPATLMAAEAARARLAESDAMTDQQLQQNAQGVATRIVDKKAVTKVGGDSEQQLKLINGAQDNEDIKAHRVSRAALDRFTALVKSGADSAAIADFIAGKGGLGQGSFGPVMVNFVDKLGLAGRTVEQIRSMFSDGMRPELIKKIGDALAAQTANLREQASPVISYYEQEFRQAGIDPRIVGGGKTERERESAAGASDATYQGKR